MVAPCSILNSGDACSSTQCRHHLMPTLPPALVLLVQPERDDRDMYAEFLRYRGLAPMVVSTVRDALTVAPRADVIVTGLLLPGHMDGIELLARVKTDARTRAIPVIVLTACAGNSDRERAERAGCDVFLTKPCLPSVLGHELDRMLTRHRIPKPQPLVWPRRPRRLAVPQASPVTR
jgi:CheY-like chemotaxis protein